MRRISGLFLLITAVGTAAFPAPAPAAPPSNDDVTDARTLSIPSSVNGTTRESTSVIGGDSDPTGCTSTRGAVWYRFTANRSGNVIIQLDAAGRDLDANVDVLQRNRSRFTQLECEQTDRNGQVTLSQRVEQGKEYLIRVAALFSSREGDFALSIANQSPPARLPGRNIGSGSISTTVDAAANPSDAYSIRLRRGVTYRVGLASRGERCVNAVMVAPRTTRSVSDALEDPTFTVPCGDTRVFTPGEGEDGRWSIVVAANTRERGIQGYRFRVARATIDDTSPGRFLSNDRRVSGSLSDGSADTYDLYRFSVARRSNLRLQLSAQADVAMELLSDRGRRLGIADTGEGTAVIEERVRPGRYFLAVRTDTSAAGRYRLHRLTRQITRTRAGVSRRVIAPGGSLSLSGRVRPGVPGRVTLTVQRFDPLAGWLFADRFTARTRSGVLIRGYTPRSTGRWRVIARYSGTRRASRSESGYRYFFVRSPLR